MSDAHHLKTRDGRVAVTVLGYGLTIQAIEVQAHDRVHDVLAGPEDLRVHSRNRQFFGPVIGRYANRLPAGRTDTADVAVQLEEWGGAQIHHHGGPPPVAAPAESVEQRGPWDCVVWSRVEEPQLFDAQALGAWDAVGVWAIESPDGDQGYPGRLRVEACVGVREVPARIGDVHVEYRARLMDSTDATPLNMTQHWGFYFGSHDGSVLDHTLQLGPRGARLERLALDAHGVPTGELVPCTDAAHDWQLGKRIGASMPPGGYDHFYVWGPSAGRVAHVQGACGVAMDVTTNQTGVQLYTANAAAPLDGAAKRAHGQAYGRHCAAFLEFSAPHATFLRAPLARRAETDTLLRRGETG
ncbi:aldose 1-epimerase [Malassezia caprae]|uniref:Aldose 1-epimerase n=1 Tax=Malassezia caprae TaxID=1381934 RepID=A0AAF0E8Q9_9BASI|nr:aldose 1-epimerase [Malassezia caprae]